jgi:RNA polymerase sigma factor (sigma-70 family)
MPSPEHLNAKQNQLIVDHVYLVPPVVNGFMAHDSRRPRIDVESDGNFGLVNAAINYDAGHEKAAPFDIYASRVIKQFLYDGARRYFGTAITRRLSSFDARNTSLDDTQRDSSTYPLDSPGSNPEAIVLEQMDAAQTFSLLLPRERICLLRYYVDGVDMDTLASELELSKSTISRTLGEATHTIRNNARREKRAGR